MCRSVPPSEVLLWGDGDSPKVSSRPGMGRVCRSSGRRPIRTEVPAWNRARRKRNHASEVARTGLPTPARNSPRRRQASAFSPTLVSKVQVPGSDLFPNGLPFPAHRISSTIVSYKLLCYITIYYITLSIRMLFFEKDLSWRGARLVEEDPAAALAPIWPMTPRCARPRRRTHCYYHYYEYHH